MPRPHDCVARPAQRLCAAAFALGCVPVSAASLTVQLTLPTQETSSYYRPYLAAWIEQEPSRQALGTLTVWYDTRLRDGLGKSWLRNLRSWWRTSGEQMTLPADGVSGATRAPGTHTLTFEDSHPALAALPAGQYQLVVEAAREQGGRELVRVPFQWGSATLRTRIEGRSELGAVTVSTQP